MQALWLFLKENVKCGNKLNDVLWRPQKFGNRSSYVLEKKDKLKKTEDEEDSVPFMKTPTRLADSMLNNTQARLYGKVFIIGDHFTTATLRLHCQSLMIELL
jgi:hypothetical protein